ncbi:MAG TPA: iron uptake system protein EfeO [Paraburkholderia sp.]|uniref:iron uptake system protein EfeO n=1 Tax=Paraburkholderia sp. TaxID=1926495 RepID=UPI002BD125A1|nr:iron uptake system protein EfeO [Paraburkholderia sp.]HTR08581.1 iron uptake system protein EfeO [Paraburkholderia sp.]
MSDRSTLAAPQQLPVKTVRAALAVSILLVLAGLVLFYQATRFAQRAHSNNQRALSVEVGAHECTPSSLSVLAGPAVFNIHNTSDRAVEWEILDGVMVIEERENIAPGFTQSLSVDLAPGNYAITCGLLSNPRGSLVVTPAADAAAKPATLSTVDFIGPLSEYRVYLGIHAAGLASAAKSLSSSIQAADLAAARDAYATAHAEYARIAPVAALFADLDHRIDAPALYFDKGAQDPAFSGFYRIAYGLYGQGDTTGLKPVADKLAADIAALSTRIDALSMQPAQLANLAVRHAEQVRDRLAADVKTPYAKDSGTQFEATLDGIREISDLLTPLLKTDPSLGKALADNFSQLDATLKKLAASANGSPIAVSTNNTLSGQINALIDSLRRVNPALGLEHNASSS